MATDELRERIASAMGIPAVSWRRAEQGFTGAERWIANFPDGASVFVKMATDPLTAAWLRSEQRVYEHLREDFLPRLIAWEDHPSHPMLVLEDLSEGWWPPPWRPGDVERVLDALDRLHRTPAALTLEALHEESWVTNGWTKVAAYPEAFLRLGLVSSDWLEQALPTLLEAAATIDVAGDALVHFDIRSDNLCLLPDRVVFVDWNWAMRGDPGVDVAFWLPSLRLEGGPLPDEILPEAGGWAAAVSGAFSALAGRPPDADPNAARRRLFQLRQARVSLPWAARALGLPPQDGTWARDGCRRLDVDLDAGRITEDQWHDRVEEILGDAYLGTEDPRAGSGKSGDETEWRWSRELVLDVCRDGDVVLDVGCANGYLMESLERWGAERGLTIEAHGLEISWRLADLARRRLPSHADRIHTGNVLAWTPPRRYDVVHTGLDYAPPARRRELVERILRAYLAPGGRLVLRAERVAPGADDVPAQLRALGFEPSGVLESLHPVTGDVRRTAWLERRSL